MSKLVTRKYELSDQDVSHIKDALDMYMKSVRRSINTVGPGDIADAYGRKLAALAAVESRFLVGSVAV